MTRGDRSFGPFLLDNVVLTRFRFRPSTSGRDKQRHAIQEIHSRGPGEPVQQRLQTVVQRRRHGNCVQQRPLEGVGQDTAAVEHLEATQTTAVARVLRRRRCRARDRSQS